MIRHIVMWKFKENEDENKKKFLEGLKSLYGVIPEIKYMEVKDSINNHNDFDACLISDFESLEDLNTYKVDPRHVEVSELCKSIRIERAAIDFEI